MGRCLLFPIMVLLASALFACSGTATTEELEGPVRQIVVRNSGQEIPMSASLRGRLLDRLRLPEGIRGIEASWLELKVRFHNASSDTVRLIYADTGCMIEVELSPSVAGTEQGPLWHGPRGCTDVARMSRLLPDQQDTVEAYLTTIEEIFGDSLQPGMYSVAATLKLDIERHTSDGWETLVTDTALMLSLDELELPAPR